MHQPTTLTVAQELKNMRLENNQQFPTVVARRVGDGEVTVPDDLAESWSVLLFYRGDW